MQHRTMTGLLAAAVVLLVANWIVSGSSSAEGRGSQLVESSGTTGTDPCPPDIDDDGMVGVTDLLQVLGAWGPCPSPPRIVGLAAASTTLVRIWSDGLAEYRAVPASIYGVEWTPQEWTTLPNNANAPLSQPIAVTAQESSTNTFYRKWADGSFDWISLVQDSDNFIQVVSKGWTTVSD